MPNPTDTARALVTNLEQLSALKLGDEIVYGVNSPEAFQRKAQIDNARAALLAHVAGVERQLNTLRGDYADSLKAERAASYILVADGYVRCTAPACNCGSWHKRDTRPAEARDE